jgi:hypothetical protein
MDNFTMKNFSHGYSPLQWKNIPDSSNPGENFSGKCLQNTSTCKIEFARKK